VGVEIQLKSAKPTHYEQVPQTLGEHVKKRRARLGLTQKEVAESLEVSLWTMLKWELGEASPLTQFLPRIIAFLGYDPFPEPQTLADQLAARRRTLGWSRKFAAAQLGIDEKTLAAWERGTAQPRGIHVRLVENFLKAPGAL
jgi:DNA-binding transcriptional regulator YiaG